MLLPLAFYLSDNVVEIAQNLLGKVLVSKMNDQICSGIISETEAYAGITDKASHAYGGRYTSRTKTMYLQGGRAYVYLCYGMHALFNVVTGKEGIPHAVLIRAIIPLEGKNIMEHRLHKKIKGDSTTTGPGKLTKAMGISLSENGQDLQGNRIQILDRKINLTKQEIQCSPRIGVDYAGEDASLLYRFFLTSESRQNILSK